MSRLTLKEAISHAKEAAEAKLKEMESAEWMMV